MRPVTTLFISASLLLASCSQGEEGAGIDSGRSGGQLPISVDAGIAGAALSHTTRAAGFTPVPDGGAIGIFRTAPVTTDSPAQYDVKYTYAEATGLWSPESPTAQITVGGEDATLCAYYPQGKVTFNPASTVTTLTVKDYAADDDLCYADKPTQPAVNNSQRKVSFQMVHAYSRIQFSITRYAQPSTDLFPCKVSSITLEPAVAGSDFYIERTLDISYGERDASQLGGTTVSAWTLDTSALPMGSSGISSAGGDTSIDKLFPPQTFTTDSGTKVSLTIDGLVQQVIIPYAKLPQLAAGNIYVIKLELHGLSLKLQEVETQDWTDVTVGSGDEYETH